MSEENYQKEVNEKEWYEAWRGRMLRTLVRPLAIDLQENFKDISNVKLVGVSSEPEKYIDRMYRITGDTCPLCGELTTPSNRKAVKLELRFGKDLAMGASTWTHKKCFDECTETEIEAGIPW